MTRLTPLLHALALAALLLPSSSATPIASTSLIARHDHPASSAPPSTSTSHSHDCEGDDCECDCDHHSGALSTTSVFSTWTSSSRTTIYATTTVAETPCTTTPVAPPEETPCTTTPVVPPPEETEECPDEEVSPPVETPVISTPPVTDTVAAASSVVEAPPAVETDAPCDEGEWDEEEPDTDTDTPCTTCDSPPASSTASPPPPAATPPVLGNPIGPCPGTTGQPDKSNMCSDGTNGTFYVCDAGFKVFTWMCKQYDCAANTHCSGMLPQFAINPCDVNELTLGGVGNTTASGGGGGVPPAPVVSQSVTPTQPEEPCGCEDDSVDPPSPDSASGAVASPAVDVASSSAPISDAASPTGVTTSVEEELPECEDDEPDPSPASIIGSDVASAPAGPTEVQHQVITPSGDSTPNLSVTGGSADPSDAASPPIAGAFVTGTAAADAPAETSAVGSDNGSTMDDSADPPSPDGPSAASNEVFSDSSSTVVPVPEAAPTPDAAVNEGSDNGGVLTFSTPSYASSAILADNGVTGTSLAAAPAATGAVGGKGRRFAAYADMYDTFDDAYLSQVTHLYLAWVNMTTSPKFDSWISSTLTTSFADVTVASIKAKHPGIKVYASFGGWGLDDAFPLAVATAESRTAFVGGIVDYLKARPDLDGIDFDWEYPGGHGAKDPWTPRPGQNTSYASLLTELRTALDTNFPPATAKKDITLAVPGLFEDMQIGYDAKLFPAIDAAVDFYNLMSYDLVNRVSTNSKNPYHASIQGIHSGIEMYTSKEKFGTDPKKINVGFPMYAKVFPIKECANTSDVTSCTFYEMQDAKSGQDHLNSTAFRWNPKSNFPPIDHETGRNMDTEPPGLKYDPSLSKSLWNQVNPDGLWEKQLTNSFNQLHGTEVPGAAGYSYNATAGANAWIDVSDQDFKWFWSWMSTQGILDTCNEVMKSTEVGGSFVWAVGQDFTDETGGPKLPEGVNPDRPRWSALEICMKQFM